MRFLLVNVNNNSRSVAINIEKTRIDSDLRFFPFLFDSIRNCIKSNRETVFFAWVCGYLFFVCLFRCFARIFWEVNSSTFHIILEICIEARNRQSVRRYTVVSHYTIAYTLTGRERQRKMEDRKRKRNIHAPMHIHTTAGKIHIHRATIADTRQYAVAAFLSNVISFHWNNSTVFMCVRNYCTQFTLRCELRWTVKRHSIFNRSAPLSALT